MYDELVKALRLCAMTDLSEEEYPCDPCEYEAPEKYHIKNKVCYLGCSQQMMLHAADAIEELSLTAESYKRSMEAWADEAANAQPRWIPVTERLPKDLTRVIVFCEDGVSYGLCEHLIADDEEVVEWHDFLHYPITPTHWMPLPQPPKENKDADN